MLVDKIAYGLATFTFTPEDLNALAAACTEAVENIIDEKEGHLRNTIETMGATFTAAWFATKAQMDAPMDVAGGDAASINDRGCDG